MSTVTQKWMHNLARRRQMEKLHAEIDEVIKKNNLCAYEQAVAEQNCRRRFSRAKGTMEMERQMESQWLACQAARQQRDKEIEDDERLAHALNRRRREEVTEEVTRARVRNESMDIRQLEAKLRAAYVQKELHAQIVEKQAAEFDQAARNAEIESTMTEAAQKVAQEEQAQKEAGRRRRLEVQKACFEMAQQKDEADHGLALQEFRRDRLRTEEVLRAEAEREEAERHATAAKKEELRRSYTEACESARRAREAEAARQRQEEARATQQERAAANRNAEAQAKRQARHAYLHSLSTAIAQRITSEQQKKLELEEMRLEVYTTRARAEEERAAEAARQQRRRMEAELREAYEAFKANELRRKIEDTAQQAAIRRALEAEEAEQELRARRADEERRRREREYASRLRQQFQEKLEEFRQQQEEERQTVRRLDEELQRDLATQEEERLKILREHVPKLVGYLPKGVFRSEQEAAQLGIVIPKAESDALNQLED